MMEGNAKADILQNNQSGNRNLDPITAKKCNHHPWRIEDSDLLNFPSNYTIQRNTHVTVYGSTASVLSGRISEFARVHSIFIDQENSREVNRCLCSTADDLVFEISLWKTDSNWANRQNKNKNSDELKKTKENNNKRGIIVEARKLLGHSLSAHKLRIMLFRTLGPKKKINQFKQAKDMLTPSCDLTQTSCLPKPLPKDLFKNIAHSVSTASNLIKFHTHTEIANGMELLNYLSSKNHSNIENRSHVNKMILTGIDPTGHNNDVMDVLHACAIDNARSVSSVAHRWAIKIVGTALFDIGACADLTPQDFTYWNDIIPVLLQDIDHLNTDPHLACSAIRCLRAWIAAKKKCFRDGTLGPGASQVGMDMNTLKLIIMRMVSYGRDKYADLEVEAMALYWIVMKT